MASNRILIVIAILGAVALGGCIPDESATANTPGSGATTGTPAAGGGGGGSKPKGGNVDDPNDKTGILLTPGGKLKDKK